MSEKQKQVIELLEKALPLLPKEVSYKKDNGTGSNGGLLKVGEESKIHSIITKALALLLQSEQSENERLKKELAHETASRKGWQTAYNKLRAELDAAKELRKMDIAQIRRLQAEHAKAKEAIKIAHKHLTGDDPYGYATEHTLVAIDTLEQALRELEGN